MIKPHLVRFDLTKTPARRIPLPLRNLADIATTSFATKGIDMEDIAATGVAGEELKQFIERIERLEEEKKAISDDIKEVFGEMKGRGYDVKVVRQVLRIRKTDRAERQEQEAILDLYLNALGIV